MSFDVKQKLVFPFILLILSVSIVFVIAEGSLRLLNIGYGNAPQESHRIFHHVHPAEYRFLSHGRQGEFGGHEVYYDQDRLVSNPNFVNRDDRDCLIVFLGDSFTEAGQVAYEDSFVGLLEENSHCQIKNFGVSSYSPIFYLLQWRAMVKTLQPSLVVVQLYSNDISADKDYMAIAIKSGNGEVVAIPGPGGGYITKQLRKSYFLRFVRKVQMQLLWMYEDQGEEKNIVAGLIEENPDVTPLSYDIIHTLSTEVEASGAQFVFTVVPSKFHVLNMKMGLHQKSKLQFSDKWKLMAQNDNISFLDLVDAFDQETKNGLRLFFDHDIHFEKNGHMLVASELSQAYPSLFKKIQLGLD